MTAPERSEIEHGRSEQIQLNQVGCEARKIPVDAELFFLDFPFYRTYRDLTAWSEDNFRVADKSSGIKCSQLILASDKTAL